MMVLILLSSLIFSLIIQIGGIDTSSEAVEEVSTKLKNIEEIFINIENHNFSQTLQSLLKWDTTFLQSVEYFSNIILLPFQEETKELVLMKDNFRKIHKKMKKINPEFAKVKKTFDWSVVKINYSMYEMVIGILHDMIGYIFDATMNVRSLMVKQFIIAYDTMYNDISQKIYESLISKNEGVGTNLINAVKKFTESNPNKISFFFMGNINSIMKGLLIEIFYLSAKGRDPNQSTLTFQWETKLNYLTKRMKETLENIKKNWKSELEVEFERFNAENHHLSNKEYSTKLYQHLSEKFSWRDWFVVVYDPIFLSYNHFVYVNEGIMDFRLRGYNIAVGSKEVNSKHIDVDITRKCISDISYYFGKFFQSLAKTLLNDALLPCLRKANQNIGLAAVIKWESGESFTSDVNYSVSVKYEGHDASYNMIVMG